MHPTFLLVAAPVAALAALALRRQRSARRFALGRFARRVDLPVPDELRARLEDGVAARNLAADLGAIAGGSMAAAGALVTGSPVVGEWVWPLVLIGALFTGAAVATGLTATMQAARQPDDREPRLARATAPMLADYLAPLELHGGRVVAVLPVIALLAVTAGGALSDAVALERALSAGPVAAALLALAALAGSELAGRRLVEQPQVASSGLELAWSDALRARVLRDLVMMPICVGGYATIGVLLGTSAALPDGALRTATFGLVGLLVAAALVLALASTVVQPQRHFRRRLWPEPAVDATSGGSRPR